MDSAEPQQSVSNVVQAGDHVQIFGGKHDPDTGARRELMVVWRNNVAIWSGPVDREAMNIPGVVRRQIEIRIPISLHHEFRTGKTLSPSCR